MRVAVFCSCSEGVSPHFLHEIERLGEELARLGHTVIYGGSSSGCMGALAKGVLGARGHLTGVFPELHLGNESLHPQLSAKVVVKTMAERKARIIENADAFLIFPGGIGTLDEAFEVLALKNVGALTGPILFYDHMDAFKPLLESLQLMVEQRLIRCPLPELLRVLDKVSDLSENLS